MTVVVDSREVPGVVVDQVEIPIPPLTLEIKDQTTERLVKGFLDLFVLDLLGGRPKYGSEIIKELELTTGTRIGPGTLYPLLYDLEAKRLVSGEWMSPRRTRRMYKITSVGEAYKSESFKDIGRLLSTTSISLGPSLFSLR